MWRELSPPSTDNPLEEVIDILMDCTGLIEQASSVRSEQDALNVMVSCFDLRDQAEAWHARLMAMFGEALYTLAPDESKVARTKKTRHIFPERCEFISIDIAEAYMLYWAALLVIFSVLYEFDRRKGSQPDESLDPQSRDNVKQANPRIASPFFHDALFYADQICRGVGYFVQPYMHILGGHNLLFPVAMSAQFFHGNGFHDRYEWCQDVFVALESMGLEMANVLQGTPWLTYKTGEPQTTP